MGFCGVRGFLEVSAIRKKCFCGVWFGLSIEDDRKSRNGKGWRWGVSRTWVALLAASDGINPSTVATEQA